MKSSGESILDTKSFKIYITKIAYFAVTEKIIDYSVYVPKGEKRIPTETGNMMYYCKVCCLESKAGFGKNPKLEGILYLTEQEYNERIYARGDKLTIMSGSNFIFDNFAIKDTQPNTLKLYPKSQHKQFVDKSGNTKSYIENTICNIRLSCKIGQHKLFQKKENKHFLILDGIKFNLEFLDLEEKVYTFYPTQEVWESLQHLNMRNKVRIELWDCVKRIRIDNATIQLGVYEQIPFINVLITTKSKDVLIEEREAKKAAKAAKLALQAEKALARQIKQAERERALQLELERQEAIRIEQEAEAERLKLEQEEIEHQKQLEQWEAENKRQKILRIND